MTDLSDRMFNIAHGSKSAISIGPPIAADVTRNELTPGPKGGHDPRGPVRDRLRVVRWPLGFERCDLCFPMDSFGTDAEAAIALRSVRAGICVRAVVVRLLVQPGDAQRRRTRGNRREAHRLPVSCLLEELRGAATDRRELKTARAEDARTGLFGFGRVFQQGLLVGIPS